MSEPKSIISEIPEAKFIENVAEFLQNSCSENDVNLVLKRMDDQHSRYKLLECTLLAKQKKLRIKLPELEASLDALMKLSGCNGDKCDSDFEAKDLSSSVTTHFPVSDQVYLTGEVHRTGSVYLYLGANVILEYGYTEAADVLRSNIRAAKENMDRIEADLTFITNQLTTTEVNMARVHNWSVKQRTENP